MALRVPCGPLQGGGVCGDGADPISATLAALEGGEATSGQQGHADGIQSSGGGSFDLPSMDALLVNLARSRSPATTTADTIGIDQEAAAALGGGPLAAHSADHAAATAVAAATSGPASLPGMLAQGAGAFSSWGGAAADVGAVGGDEGLGGALEDLSPLEELGLGSRALGGLGMEEPYGDNQLVGGIPQQVPVNLDPEVLPREEAGGGGGQGMDEDPPEHQQEEVEEGEEEGEEEEWQEEGREDEAQLASRVGAHSMSYMLCKARRLLRLQQKNLAEYLRDFEEEEEDAAGARQGEEGSKANAPGDPSQMRKRCLRKIRKVSLHAAQLTATWWPHSGTCSSTCGQRKVGGT